MLEPLIFSCSDESTCDPNSHFLYVPLCYYLGHPIKTAGRFIKPDGRRRGLWWKWPRQWSGRGRGQQQFGHASLGDWADLRAREGLPHRAGRGPPLRLWTASSQGKLMRRGQFVATVEKLIDWLGKILRKLDSSKISYVEYCSTDDSSSHPQDQDRTLQTKARA